MSTIEEIKEEIRDLKEEIKAFEQEMEELKKLEASKKLSKPFRWRAKNGDRYFYVDEHWESCIEKEGEFALDDWNHRIGNYHQTEEEAEAYKEYLESRYVIEQDAGGYKFNKDKDNYYGLYDIADKEVDWNYTDDFYYIGTIYFESEEAITESQTKHPKEWLAYVTYGLPKGDK